MEFVVLGLGWLAAVAVSPQRWSTAESAPTVSAPRRGIGAALAAAAVVFLLPNQTYQAAPAKVSPWFSSAEAHRVLPSGSVALTYLYPMVIFDGPMLTQAKTGMRYQLIGGQAIVPDTNGVNHGVKPLKPGAVFDVFYRSLTNNFTNPITHFMFKVGPMPANSERTARQFRLFVKIHHVRAVIWQPYGARPDIAKAYLRRAFGAPQVRDGGRVEFWVVSRN
jgi:hypothetical protein